MADHCLGVDVDGVLAAFGSSFAKALWKETGMLFPPHSDTWPTCWDWDLEAGVTKEQSNKVWKEYVLKGKKKFWENLEPLPNARAEIKQLNRLSRLGYEVYFLTHRMGEQAKLQTETWLYGLGMSYPTVLLSADKTPLIKSLGINFFIDDKASTIENLAKVASKDKWCVGGTRPPCSIYLKAAPYTTNWELPDGVIRVKGIEEALRKEGLWKETGGW